MSDLTKLLIVIAAVFAVPVVAFVFMWWVLFLGRIFDVPNRAESIHFDDWLRWDVTTTKEEPPTTERRKEQ